MLECMCEPSKSAYCETCCLTPAGLCTPLSSINLVYVNESNTLLAKLRGAVFLPYETLGHKVWRENEICLSYGRTGYCQRGVCDLAAPTVILNSEYFKFKIGTVVFVLDIFYSGTLLALYYEFL